MEVYLGRESAKRVIQGSVHRGQAAHINAVILYSDLRNSTQLTSSLGPENFLELLNYYMERVSEPIMSQGGEVLRFIGDAIIAIFPYGEKLKFRNRQQAAEAALAAAKSALNPTESKSDGGENHKLSQFFEQLRFGISIHAGELLYGNFGTRERLNLLF